MLEPESKKEIKKQLNSIAGQLQAIGKMLDDDRDAYDIFIQFKAVEGILNKSVYQVMDDLFRKKLASRMVRILDECYSEECPHCRNLEEIKKEFSELEMEDILKYLKQLDNCG